MANNVDITAGTGTTVATDQLADNTHVQLVKLVDGTEDGTARIPGGANGLLVQAAGAATSTVTNVAASATNVTLISSNTGRKALYIFNGGTANLYVKLGTTATTTTSFTYMLVPNGFWELPDDPIYNGRVDGIWSATGGNGALITELT